MNWVVNMTNLTAATGRSYSDAKPQIPTNSVLNAWKYYAVVIDNETLHEVRAYQDGDYVKKAIISDVDQTLCAVGGNLTIGNTGASGKQAFPGIIDEVRISNVARSADWMKASYDTVNNDEFAFYFVSNDWTKYSHTFSVAFPNYTGATALVAFPALVKVSESAIPGFRYADCLKLNGGDLRFADAEGNLLDSEVDTWNPGGESFVWVSLPTLTNNVAIKAYYGWEWAPEVNGANVWTNGYVGVWHMGEATLPLKDSVNGGTSLTETLAGATLPGQPGLAGNAVAFDQLSDHTGCLQTKDQRYKTSGRTDYTVEFWSYQDSFDPTVLPYNIYFMRENGSKTIWQVYGAKTTSFGSNGKTVIQVTLANGSTGNASTGNSYPLRDDWTYQNFRVSDTSHFCQGLNRNPKIYNANNWSITNDTANTTLFIGNNNSGSTTAFPGMIDEVRISSVARSDDWMNATYDTIKNAATFATYSNAKENSPGTIVIFR